MPELGPGNPRVAEQEMRNRIAAAWWGQYVAWVLLGLYLALRTGAIPTAGWWGAGTEIEDLRKMSWTQAWVIPVYIAPVLLQAIWLNRAGKRVPCFLAAAFVFLVMFGLTAIDVDRLIPHIRDNPIANVTLIVPPLLIGALAMYSVALSPWQELEDWYSLEAARQRLRQLLQRVNDGLRLGQTTTALLKELAGFPIVAGDRSGGEPKAIEEKLAGVADGWGRTTTLTENQLREIGKQTQELLDHPDLPTLLSEEQRARLGGIIDERTEQLKAATAPPIQTLITVVDGLEDVLRNLEGKIGNLQKEHLMASKVDLLQGKAQECQKLLQGVAELRARLSGAAPQGTAIQEGYR